MDRILLLFLGLAIARAPVTVTIAADADARSGPITVHYHRFEQDYNGVSLWTWDEHNARRPEANELNPTGKDAFGVVFKVDPSQYGQPGERIGLLPRLNHDWQFKDGPDRFWQPSLGREVFIVQGQPEVYAKLPDVRPRLACATLDGARRITVRFTHRLAVADWTAAKFKLTDNAGTELAIAAVEPENAQQDKAVSFALVLEQPAGVERAADLKVAAGALGTASVRIGRILQDGALYGDEKAVLGATYTSTETTFRVFAPTAQKVWVVLADAAEGAGGREEKELHRRDRGIWESSVTGDLAGEFYAYRLEGPGLDAKVEVTDIYATCTQNRAVRSLIVDLSATDPPGFREQTYSFAGRPTDAIIYELHVRDFSIAPNSGITHKGQYLGLIETGTQLVASPQKAGSHAPPVTTGLDHLFELGVTHVQLMPIEDFDNDESRSDSYNWGYMTVNFNSPDGWYATKPSGPTRIRELKQAIKALHDRRIGVVMDVVYNHTADRASFERLVPGYYFRMNADGSFSNGSGCGNEFASETPMGRKFLLDSLRYWVREYDVDGFRFDLMGLIDLQTLKQIKTELAAIKPGILIYGEPWTGGPTPLNPITGHPQVRGTGLGAFNDHFRDAIKGDRDGGLPGFAQVGDRVWGIRLGLEGAVHDWSADPLETINYFEAHDNLTAWDKMLQCMPNATDAERRKAMRLASLILLTSQGAVFMQSGQEFCRSKQGSSNSYNQPDAINQIDWSAKTANADVYSYVRALVAIRRAHPALRLATRAELDQRSYFFDAPNDRCLVWRIKGDGLPGESAKEILVLLCGSAQPTGFPLISRGWHVLADADRASVEPFRDVDDGVQLPPHSGMLLVR